MSVIIASEFDGDPVMTISNDHAADVIETLLSQMQINGPIPMKVELSLKKAFNMLRENGEKKVVTGTEYQKAAMRTYDGESNFKLRDTQVNNINKDFGGIVNAALGLSGEVGELNDMLKNGFSTVQSLMKYI